MIYEQVRLYFLQNKDRHLRICEIANGIGLKHKQVENVIFKAFKIGWVKRKEKVISSTKLQTYYKIVRTGEWEGLGSYYRRRREEKEIENG